MLQSKQQPTGQQHQTVGLSLDQAQINQLMSDLNKTVANDETNVSVLDSQQHNQQQQQQQLIDLFGTSPLVYQSNSSSGLAQIQISPMTLSKLTNTGIFFTRAILKT